MQDENRANLTKVKKVRYESSLICRTIRMSAYRRKHTTTSATTKRTQVTASSITPAFPMGGAAGEDIVAMSLPVTRNSFRRCRLLDTHHRARSAAGTMGIYLSQRTTSSCMRAAPTAGHQGHRSFQEYTRPSSRRLGIHLLVYEA